MNEFIMGYTEDWIDLDNAVGPDSVAGSINRPSGFQLAHFFPANDSNQLLPALSVSGGGPDFYEDAGNHAWHNSNPIVTWKDNVAWMHGNHYLKFGFFLEDYHKNEQFGADTQGILYTDNGSSVTSGNALADLFLGRFSQYNEGTQTFNGVPLGGYPKGHWQQWDFEPYFQDQWRIRKDLTLTLGVRYYLFTHIHDISRPTVDSGFLPQDYNPAAEAQYNAAGNLIQGTGALPIDFGNGLVECGSHGVPSGCQTNSYKNIAPRFGFSWDPWGTGKTVIRGGYGIYFEPGNGNEAQSEGGEGNPPVSLSLSSYNLLGFGSVGNIFNNGVYSAPIPPAGYTAWPYSQKWPSTQQFSFGVQHQFGNNNLVSLSYVGALGRHLARFRNLTEIPLGLGTVNVPQLAGLTDNTGNQVCDSSGNCNAQQVLINQLASNIFFQPYRGYSSIGMKEDTAISNYNSLQATVRHTFGHGLTAQASYTWAHSLDDSTSTYSSSANSIDDSNLSRWYATSDLNRAQIFTINYIYTLPFFNSSHGFLHNALGGWQISGISSFFTGEPVNITCGVNGFSTGIGTNVMCNTVGPVKIQKGTYNDPTYGPRPTWFNPGAMTQPLMSQLPANGEPGMFGYMGRNALTGPGRDDTDLALIKNFSAPWFSGEHSTIQFRWETFNSFNHPQWQSISAGCDGNDGFGQPCNSPANDIGNGEVTGAWPSRIMQFGLKILF